MLSKEELQEKLEYEVVPDIMQCNSELSQHNRQGEYRFNCNGQELIVTFKWQRGDK